MCSVCTEHAFQLHKQGTVKQETDPQEALVYQWQYSHGTDSPVEGFQNI